MKKIPELRFPEFKETWEMKTLAELGTFFKGSTLAKGDLSEEGESCILYGELYTTYSEIIDTVYSKTSIQANGLVRGAVNDVLIPSSGESAVDIATASCLQESNVLLGGDINVFRPYEVNGVFISYQLNNSKRHEIAKVAQGASVVHVYNEQLKKIKVMVPSIDEQNKLSKLFYTIDKKINLHQKKVAELEKYKKGIIQKIFSREIRFKKEDGSEYIPWKEELLGQHIIEHTEKTQVNNQYPVLTSSRQGLLLQEDHFKGRQVTTDENIGYHIIPYGYVTFRSRSDDGYFRFNINKIIEKGIVSYFYPVFTFNEQLDSDFAVTYMNNYLCKQIVKEVVGTSQLVLSLNKLKNLKVPVPDIEEQRKITALINVLDKKITTEQLKLSELKTWKKGLLQKMFI